MNWEGYEVEGQMDITEFLDKGENMTENEVNMTENEAINYMIAFRGEWDRNSKSRRIKALDTAIKALIEVQKYREIGLTPELIEAMQGHNVALINDLGEYQAIGTVEEFKALKEKNVAKKPIIHGLGQRYCPVCKCGGADHFYCARCGQKLG